MLQYPFSSKLIFLFFCCWNLSVTRATHLINRLPSPLLNDNTPYFLLHNKPSDYSTLKSFGCLTYTSTLLQNITKFDYRSHNCVFLGYREGTKEYLLYNIVTNQFIVSWNVTLYEDIYPLTKTHDHWPLPPITTLNPTDTDLEPLNHPHQTCNPPQTPPTPRLKLLLSTPHSLVSINNFHITNHSSQISYPNF